MYKLPVKQILIDAFVIPWNDKALYTRVLAPPVFLLVATWGIWVLAQPEGALLNYLYLFLHLAAFAYFAVTCHRLILVDANTHHSYNTLRIIFFIKWIVIIYGISFVIEMISLTIFINLLPDSIGTEEVLEDVLKEHGEQISINMGTIREVLYLPLTYIVGRFSLIFPVTAVDLRGSLKWSWKATRNNGLNILCIVGFLPWFMYVLLSFIQRENSTIFEQAILALLTFLVTAISIFALSLTYRALQQNAQKEL